MTIIISKSSPSDLLEAKNLLNLVDLTTQGIDDQFNNFFLVKERNKIIGLGGLETHEKKGLLRSLAVLPEYRNNNIGKKLLYCLLGFASDLGLDEIFLLTETAENYFKKFNFTAIDRKDTPREIKDTIEFSEACPKSATVMKLGLRKK